MGLLWAGQNLSLYQVAQPRASLDPSAFFCFYVFLYVFLDLSNPFSLHRCAFEFRGARSLALAFRAGNFQTLICFWCTADELLAALDGTYCAVSPVESEGAYIIRANAI
jgi:hypothetical protein